MPSGSNNGPGPMGRGSAVLAGVCVGIGHFVLWVVIGATLSHVTGSDKWSYYFDGFALVSSFIAGLAYGSILMPGVKYKKILLPLAIPMVYGLFGATMVSQVPKGGVMWLILGLVGLPISADLFRRYHRLPKPTSAEMETLAAQIPPAETPDATRRNRLGCAAFLAMGLAGVTCSVVGIAMSTGGRMEPASAAERLFMGGTFLFLAAVMTAAAAHLLWTKKVPVRRSFWHSQFAWRDRSEAPTRYVFYLLLFSLLAVTALLMATAFFLGLSHLESNTPQ